jgi:molybdenum cofactor cytidylyltransferase
VIAALVLAAGAGSRFGGAKQLHPVQGAPMLERVLSAVASAAVDDRVVVLGARATQIVAAVDLHGARSVVCAAWPAGQAASLRCGLAALSARVSAAIVVLGDGPHLAPAAIDRVAAAARPRPGVVLAADYGCGRAHPVLLPRAVWDRLPATGETPARGLPTQLVDCRDLRPPGDVDYASA